MTPSERQALLMFMGNVYGQAAKADSEIVNASQHLRPISQQIKEQFTQVLSTPVDNYSTSPAQSQPVTVETERTLQSPNISPPVLNTQTPPASPFTIVPDDNILSVLKEINLNIKRVVDILDNKNVKSSKKPRVKKQERVH